MTTEDDLIAFLRAVYDKQAADHWHVSDGCMQCGSDWPCNSIRDLEAKATLLGIAVVMLEPHPIPADAAPLGAARVEGQNEANRMGGEVILKVLAAPHDDEPGYLKEWKL